MVRPAGYINQTIAAQAARSAAADDAALLYMPIDAGLDALADVDLATTPPTDGQALVFHTASGLWIPATLALSLALDGLTDVDTSTTPPTDGQVLEYHSASGLWIPASLPTPGATNLNGLSDVDLTPPPTDGQVLEYDNASSQWKAASLPAIPSSASIRRLTVAADSSAAHILASADIWGHRRFTNAGSVTLTVDNTHGFSIGDRARFTQAGAGQVTMVAGAGITLNSRDSSLKSAGQFAVWELELVAANEFDVLGDVTA
jgi:hypothetical protein